MNDSDWIHQQNLTAWKARLRQLRLELTQERTEQQPLRLLSQEVVSSAVVEQEQKAAPSANSHSRPTIREAIRKSVTLQESRHANVRKVRIND